MNPIAAATCSRLFLAIIYNQSQLAERKHVARYWSINTAVTAVPLIAHPSTTNHIVRFRSFLVYILYGFLYTKGANSWGRFWCTGCNSVNRTCSTSTLLLYMKLWYAVHYSIKCTDATGWVRQVEVHDGCKQSQAIR